MTHLPTPPVVHDWAIQLRKAGLTHATWEQELNRAIRRDRVGSTVPDGYPRSTGGGGGGGGLSDPAGHGAVALLERNYERDRHHELTVAAAESLAACLAGWQRFVGAMAGLRQLTSDDGPAPKRCQACAGRRGRGNDRTDIHRGTVGDRLEAPVDLCRACRGYVESTARPGSRDGWLPDDEAIERHETTGRWRIRRPVLPVDESAAS